MKQENKQELYASPEVEVLETMAEQVLCQSGNTQQYGDGTGEDWFY